MSVLKIKDSNGNWIDIEAIKGADGKSAYEQAKDGGYTGTEEEFITLLNGLTNFEDAGHYINYDNPHKVTPTKIGALPITGGTLTGKTLYFDNGNARISGGEDYMQMDVFDSPKDDSNRRKLVVNGNKTALNGAVVLTVREDGVDNTYTIYGGHNKPKASDIGALSIEGGTLTGQALYLNNGIGRIQSGNSFLQLDIFDVAKEGNNRRKLVLNGKNSGEAFNECFVLASIENGQETVKQIFGEHNKPSGTYTGNGQPRDISIDGVGHCVMICKYYGGGLGGVSFVTDAGALYLSSGLTAAVISKNYISFSNSILHIGNLASVDMAYFNSKAEDYKFYML